MTRIHETTAFELPVDTQRPGNGHLRLAFFSGNWIPPELPVVLPARFRTAR